jgi:hypothetical protein
MPRRNQSGRWLMMERPEQVFTAVRYFYFQRVGALPDDFKK